MRCMTAIWPAGPPKLRLATRSQVQNASRSDTPCSGCERPSSAIEISAMTSLFRGRRGPIVRLGLQRAAPGIERVVHDHAVLEHFVVVVEICREAERDRKQAAALRGEVVP